MDFEGQTWPMEVMMQIVNKGWALECIRNVIYPFQEEDSCNLVQHMKYNVWSTRINIFRETWYNGIVPQDTKNPN